MLSHHPDLLVMLSDSRIEFDYPQAMAAATVHALHRTLPVTLHVCKLWMSSTTVSGHGYQGHNRCSSWLQHWTMYLCCDSCNLALTEQEETKCRVALPGQDRQQQQSDDAFHN